MNLWIEIAREALVEVIGQVDCVILNDAELRQLTGTPELVAAATGSAQRWGRRSWWPSRASTAPC